MTRRTQTPGRIVDMGGVSPSPWIPWTPTIGCSSGAFGSTTVVAAYMRMGRDVFIRCFITVVAIGTAAGDFNITVPYPYGGFSRALAGREVAHGLGALISYSGGGSIMYFGHSVGISLATGDKYVISGVYDATTS